MLIYLLTFAIALVSAYFASRMDFKARKLPVIGLSLVAILVPAIVAGCRAVTIGTDIAGYVTPNFDYALTGATLKEMFNYYVTKEPFFTLMVYGIANLFGNVQWMLFAMSLITVGCAYIGAYRLREKAPMALLLAVYLLMYYNDSYNLMRQHMAMAILFLGAKDLLEGKYVRYLVCIVAAALFHTMAAGAICFVIIHFLLYSWKQGKHAKVIKWLVIIGAAFVCLVCPVLLKYIVNATSLSEKYGYYFDFGSVSGNKLETLIYLMEVAVVFIFARGLRSRVQHFDYLQTNACLSLIVLQLGRVIYYGNRIGMFFSIINLIMVAQLPKITENKALKGLVTAGVVAVALFYWYYLFIHGGNGETYPYLAFWNYVPPVVEAVPAVVP